MPRKKTNQEFLLELKEKNPNIVPLEEYINGSTSIWFKCLVCGHKFKNSPSKILSKGQGCGECYRLSRMMSEEEFIKRAEKNEHVKIRGKYRGTKEKIEVDCVYCGETFYPRADNVIDNRGHINCMQKLIERIPTLTQDEFLYRLSLINPNIKPLGDYVKQADYMWFECIICGNKWYAKTGHILLGDSGCSHCNSIMSKGEQRVAKWLTKNNILFFSQFKYDDCRDENPLPFDFKLIDKNICIEYDGEQHFKENSFFNNSLDYIKNHDEIKNNYCKNNNITLIRIPYTDFNNIDKILNEKLLN